MVSGFRLDARNRWLLALVVVLAVACVFVWRRVPPAASAYHPFYFDASVAMRFELENAAGRFVFERPVDGEWRIASPVEWAADHLAIAVMVQALETVRTAEALPTGPTPEDRLQRAGLGARAARFAVVAGGRRLAGRIAEPRTVGERTPACADDRRGVFVIANRIARMFHGSLNHYRDRRALPFDRAEWWQVRFVGRAGRVTLQERRPGGEWTLTEPRAAAPDPAWASSVIERLPRLRAMGWLAPEEEAPAAAFGGPTRTIAVSWGYDGTPRTATLEVGAPRDDATSWARLASAPQQGFGAPQQVFWVGTGVVKSLFPASPEAAIRRE